MRRHSAEWLLLLITVLWAGTFAVIKTEVADLSPVTFVILRFLTASVVGLFLWGSSLSSLNKEVLLKGVVLGVLFGGGFLLQTVGLTSTSASNSAFITGTMVVFVPIVQRFIGGNRLKPNHAISICLVLIGLAVFTSPEAGAIVVGDVLTLASALLWAVYLTYIDVWTSALRENTHQQNALVVLQFLVTTVMASLIFIVTFVASGSVPTINVDTSLIIAVLYCGVFASVVPTFIQTRYQQYTHPVRAGLIYSIEPLAASCIAWILIDETFTARQFIGAGVMTMAIILPDLFAMWRRE